MSAERVQRIQAVFEQAVRLPPDERAAFLAQGCRGDAELRAEVESLLEHDALAGNGFLRPLNPSTATVRDHLPASPNAQKTGASDSVTATSPGELEDRAPPLIAPRIPDYELLHYIGKGGFGTVWLARERLSGVLYALKVIPRSAIGAQEIEGVRQYKQRAAGHPHLIALEHVGETSECYYYVMELADDARGPAVHTPEGYEPVTLAETIMRTGALPLPQAAEISCQILDGLDRLHAVGLLHRDVKPANVLRVRGHWKLSDIGLVTRQSRVGTAAGTPAYAPPEGVVDRGGDLFCIGKTLAEMVTGVRPSGSLDAQAIPAVQDKALAEQLVNTSARACDADPRNRFRTAREMRSAIARRSPGRERGTWGVRVLLGHWQVSLVVAGAAVVGLILLLYAFVYRPWDELGSRDMAECASASAKPALKVYFKRSADDVGHFVLDERNVPLQTGALIQIRATLPEPGYAYLFHFGGGQRPTLLYPEHGAPAAPVNAFDVPPTATNPDRQEWLPLEPPAGTEMLLLLVADQPVEDMGALEAALEPLHPPSLDESALLVGDAEQPVLRWDPTRGLGRETQAAPRGILRVLSDGWRSRFRSVSVLAFPHVDRATGP